MFTKVELRSAMTRGDQVLRFIVGESFDNPCRVCCALNSLTEIGEGNHSPGEPNIRPALEELFTGYEWCIVPKYSD